MQLNVIYHKRKASRYWQRFIAYEIIERLKNQKEDNLLDILSAAVTEREKRKGPTTPIVKESFDAKAVYNQNFFMQKYYEHSSASFYELGIVKSYQPFDFRVL